MENETKSIEQNIAEFLLQHNITIVPVRREDGVEMLEYVQYLKDGSTRDLGETLYNNEGSLGKTCENAKKQLQLKGFITFVTRPMARLIRQVNGDFYNERMEVIHDACDLVENRHSSC